MADGGRSGVRCGCDSSSSRERRLGKGAAAEVYSRLCLLCSVVPEHWCLEDLWPTKMELEGL